jgi:tetraacyldisaccharide 4'-kinase
VVIVDLRTIKPPDELGGKRRNLLLPVLVPASGIYGVATRLARAMPRRARDVGIPVISVGSIAVGGTGKTPLCMEVAGRFRDLGRRVCILSRGYRRKPGPSPLVVSDGVEIGVSVEEAGDEPYMMARRLAGVRVVVGKNRLASAMEARERMGADLIVLDDGFQVRHIARSADVLCFDGTTLRRGNHLLPWGTLREDWSALRPDHMAVVRLEGDDLPASGGEVARLAPAHVFYYVRSEPRLLDPNMADIDRSGIAGNRFVLVSGIAGPRTFERSCLAIGAEVAVSMRYEDHHWYTGKDEADVRRKMEACGADRILTTEKDFWKLPAGLREMSLILTSRPGFLDGDRFWRTLDERLNTQT